METKVVVVAPTFNEEENIEAFLKAVLAQKVEVLISDSHSTDKTVEIVGKIASTNNAVHYLDVQKRGLGLGLSRGIDYAFSNLKADAVITMEADLSADPKQFPDFLKGLDNADFIVGSRYIDGGKIINWSWWRKLLSRLANLILMFLAGTGKVHEFTNLYRAFTKNTWAKIRSKVTTHEGWLFVPAFTFEALDQNINIAEIPMIFVDRFGGRSKMKTLSYTKELLTYAIRYRLKKSASVVKFVVVGGLGFMINTVILVVGVSLGLRPSTAGPIGGELAIVFGFLANNFWTFSEDRVSIGLQFFLKFLQYNMIAFGSVLIQFSFLRVGEWIFGLTKFKSPVIDLPIIRLYTWYLFFYMAGVGVGMVINYIMYRKVVWKKENEISAKS